MIQHTYVRNYSKGIEKINPVREVREVSEEAGGEGRSKGGVEVGGVGGGEGGVE